MKPWDENKKKKILEDRGISFETARLVFDDPRAITTEDYIDENGEMRYQTLDVVEGVLIVVAHVNRVIAGIEQPWFITARKAVKYEEKQYFPRRRR
jgi:uncharacterized DUF497 family protein